MLTFTGKAFPSDSLVLVSSSVKPNEQFARFSTATYTFNNPIKINPDRKVLLLEGESAIAESSSLEVKDDKSLIVHFEELELLRNRVYQLLLPKGVVSMRDDATQVNKDFKVTIKGLFQKIFGIKKVSPDTDEKQIVRSVIAEFDLPEGFKLIQDPGYDSPNSVDVYINSISEENRIFTAPADVVGDNKLKWKFPLFEYIPGSKFILYAPARIFAVYDSEGNYRSEYTNAEIKLTYTLPTVEEANMAPLTFGKAMIGNYADGIEYHEGMKLPMLQYVSVHPEGAYTNCESPSQFFEDGRNKTYLYEITDGGDVLIKEGRTEVKKSGEAPVQYEARFYINAPLYEGRKYRLVIREGAMTVNDMALWQYVKSEALEYTFEGTAPREVKCLDCTLKEGDTVSRLYNVMYTFEGDVELKDDSYAMLRIKSPGATFEFPVRFPLVRKAGNGLQTTIHALGVLQGDDGEPYYLKDGQTARLILPEGVLYLVSDPTVTNKEICINLNGKTYVDIKAPEYVKVSMDINGECHLTQKFVKGEKYEMQLAQEGWKVDKLMRFSGEDDAEGTDITMYAENGSYKSSPIESDTRYELTLKYARPLVFADASGVATLPASSVNVFSREGDIVVEGLKGGEQISVYSPAGMTIGRHTASSDMDTIRISLEPGTYIVRVQGAGTDESAKILHAAR